MEVTVFTLEDGNYCVLDKIIYQDKTYLYLFKENEPEAVKKRKTIKIPAKRILHGRQTDLCFYT